jgi:hypothetical protein
MGLLGVARANTAVGVSPKSFLLLLLLQKHVFKQAPGVPQKDISLRCAIVLKRRTQSHTSFSFAAGAA